jgi:serine/threonine-protein kinase
MTQTGVIMGTPSYMSPEQIQGTAVSGQTDQFSLAVIAYEVLTGEKPFVAEYLPTLLYKIVRDEPISPQRLNPTLGSGVQTVLLKALAKTPADRYETCAGFINALAAACNASGWTPLPRGVSHDMPTGGDVTELMETTSDGASAAKAPLQQSPGLLRPPAPAPEDAVEPLRLRPRVGVVEEPPAEGAPLADANPPIVTPPPLPAETPARLPELNWKEPPTSHTARHVVIAGVVLAALGVAGYFGYQRFVEVPAVKPTVAAQPSPEIPPPTTDPKAPPPAVESRAPAAEPPPPTVGSKAPEALPPVKENPVKSVARPSLPAEASFRLTTTPAGAEVMFDQNPGLKCVTPCSMTLASGRHTLVIRHAGYRDRQKIIEIPQEAGAIVDLEIMTGTLSLLSNPPGLTVMIDGREQAKKTPLTLALPAGSHKVQVLKGPDKQEFTVDIRDGALVTRTSDWTQ